MSRFWSSNILFSMYFSLGVRFFPFAFVCVSLASSHAHPIAFLTHVECSDVWCEMFLCEWSRDIYIWSEWNKCSAPLIKKPGTFLMRWGLRGHYNRIEMQCLKRKILDLAGATLEESGIANYCQSNETSCSSLATITLVAALQHNPLFSSCHFRLGCGSRQHPCPE